MLMNYFWPTSEMLTKLGPALICLFGALATGFLISSISGIWLIRLLAWLGIKEKTEKTPIEDKGLRAKISKKSGTPTMGGLIIGSGLAVSWLLWNNITDTAVLLTLLCFILLAVLGGIDDLLKTRKTSHKERGLKVRHKIIFPFLIGAALGLIYKASGPATLPLSSDSLLGISHRFLLGSWPIWAITSGLVVATMSNAVNVTDGIDGLASNLSFFTFLALAGLLALQAFTKEQALSQLSVLSTGIAGAALGFLWHNTNPAKIFMGDTGSLALGGCIGFIALASGMEILLPLIGFVFLAEFFSSVIQFLWYKATRRRILPIAPLHHICEQRNWSENQIVTRLTVIAALPAMTALLIAS